MRAAPTLFVNLEHGMHSDYAYMQVSPRAEKLGLL